MVNLGIYYCRKISSIQNASDITGILHKNISNCANGGQLTAGNFRWEHI